jgi:hypothetical protein
MKCIQAIRAGKHSEIGDIKRIDDIDAQEKVTSGYWKFIPKSEWKLATRKTKEVVVEVNDQITDSVTVSEKQLKRKKTKQ